MGGPINLPRVAGAAPPGGPKPQGASLAGIPIGAILTAVQVLSTVKGLFDKPEEQPFYAQQQAPFGSMSVLDLLRRFR